jgi:hypothetical protein
MRSKFFWNVKTYSPVTSTDKQTPAHSLCLLGLLSNHADEGKKFLRKVGVFLLDYTASHSSK